METGSARMACSAVQRTDGRVRVRMWEAGPTIWHGGKISFFVPRCPATVLRQAATIPPTVLSCWQRSPGAVCVLRLLRVCRVAAQIHKVAPQIPGFPPPRRNCERFGQRAYSSQSTALPTSRLSSVSSRSETSSTLSPTRRSRRVCPTSVSISARWPPNPPTFGGPNSRTSGDIS